MEGGFFCEVSTREEAVRSGRLVAVGDGSLKRAGLEKVTEEREGCGILYRRSKFATALEIQSELDRR